MHIRQNVNNGRKSAILNSIESKFLNAYPSLKPCMFYSNDQAIWHGFQNKSIRHIEVNNSRQCAIYFVFDQVEIFQGAFFPKTSHFAL